MNESVSPIRVADIKAGHRNLTVVGRITGIGDAQTVTTRFGPARVAAATLEDETGSIRVNLWREQIDRVKVGDMVRLENAFVRTFNYQNELNIGKDGRIVVIDHS
mgnify:CR=1 FL=1